MRPADTAPAPGLSPARLAVRLGVATVARLFLNTARRFPYPFAGALGRGLGVPLPAVTSLIAASQATGLASPLFGSLADRWGYRNVMLVGLALLSVGMLAPALWPLYAFAGVGLVLAVLGKNAFDPAVQAYIGTTVSYRRRGLAIGLGELAWAGSALLGIPAAGVLMARFGWRAPFFVLAVLGAASAVALAALVPSDAPPSRRRGGPGWVRTWTSLLRHRPALAGLAFGFLISLANDALFVVYGAWLESSFGLGLAELGAATTAIGLAELGGEGLTSLLADRLGHRRALAGGVALSAAAYALLPMATGSLTAAVAVLFLVFLLCEFTVVTSFSLMTEVLPDARGTMMSFYAAALGVGRMTGALAGGPAWVAGGLPATAAIAAGASVLALGTLWWGLGTWRADP